MFKSTLPPVVPEGRVLKPISKNLIISSFSFDLKVGFFSVLTGVRNMTLSMLGLQHPRVSPLRVNLIPAALKGNAEAARHVEGITVVLQVRGRLLLSESQSHFTPRQLHRCRTAIRRWDEIQWAQFKLEITLKCWSYCSSLPQFTLSLSLS